MPYIGFSFPPPYGDYGSDLFCGSDSTSSKQKCFRPLTGIMVLTGAEQTHHIPAISDSFRPLTGIMVLTIYYDNNDKRRSNKSFRPLTGIMVLTVTRCIFDGRNVFEEFPSPYGDYGSYQHPLQMT